MKEKLKLHDLSKPINNNKDTALLSKLFRTIVNEKNFLFKMCSKVDDYLAAAHTDDIRVMKRETRTQIYNDMLAEEMTWRKFVNLIFNVLRFRKLRLIVELTDTKGEVSMHEIVTVKDVDNVEKMYNIKTQNLDDALKRLSSEVYDKKKVIDDE